VWITVTLIHTRVFSTLQGKLLQQGLATRDTFNWAVGDAELSLIWP
jgi:hypothetical protein